MIGLRPEAGCEKKKTRKWRSMRALFKLFLYYSMILFVFVLPCFFVFHAKADPFKLGLILDKGGKDDKSFNSAVLQGAMKAKDELKIFVKYVEATDDNALEPLLRSFVQKKFDLIMAIGVSQADALKKIAPQFKNQHFVIMDAEVKEPNVHSILFEEQEGSYLVGAIAALTSKTEKIGFIGGMDIPLIRRFFMGYEAGAKAINGKVKVVANYIGVTADSWNNPAKGKELALAQYDSGVDVIFAAAGASGTGLFDAAEERKKFAIGVDSNQNWVKPGFILTSMVKRLDQAVFNICKDATQGKFRSGVERLGVASHGVGYVVDSYNEKLISAATRKRVEELREQIIAGKIRVPDYYQIQIKK
jgi:basic membrane protein A